MYSSTCYRLYCNGNGVSSETRRTRQVVLEALGRSARNRSALKQVERFASERPFNIPSSAVDVLTAACEPVQLKELVVFEAKSFHELGMNLLLDCAPIRIAADRDTLESWLTFEHLARTVNPVAVRNYDSRDNRFPQPPAGLDYPLVSPGDRIPREHNSRSVGIEERLDHDADAGASEESNALPVRDCRVRVRRPPDPAQSRAQLIRGRHVEQRQMLTGKARLGTILVNRRRADG